MFPEMILHGIAISPYVKQVRAALELKGIPYTLKETLPKSILVSLNREVPEVLQKTN